MIGLAGKVDILLSLFVFLSLCLSLYLSFCLFLFIFFLVAFAVKDGASWRGGKFDIKLIALHCLRPRPEMMAKNS